MAIYVYQTSSGALVSWIPDSLTIAQAQAQKLLAPNATLTANGYSTIDSLPPLDASHVWNAATKTVNTVTPPTLANVIATFDFIMAFTPAELAAIRASSDSSIQRFLFALQVTGGVNLNHTTITNALNYLVTNNLLTSARATAILATISSGAT